MDSDLDKKKNEDIQCDICGGPILDRQCKLICLHCGYTRDCSDP